MVPREPERGRRLVIARASDLWERFWAFSSWEKLVVALGCVLAAIAAPVAVVALMTGGGGDDQPSVPAVIDLPGATSVVLPPTPTPLPTPAAPLVAEEPTEAGPADRQDCAEIRGSAYRSESEREWFLINCEVTSVANPPFDEPSEPAPPPSQPPPPPPPPDSGISAGEAIALAVDWLSGNVGLQYSINEGSCSAITFGSKWVVTCTATLQGCQGSACRTTLAACVLESGAVVSSESC